MWTIAMAYAGTNNNSAIRRLLHVAVSDVNDEVRRTSVMALGFVMFRTPEQVPSLVSLLAESYNPHVRYGAIMAIGVACAGNPSKQALDIVLPMLDDRVDFVVQGALMSLALMLMEQNDKAKSSPFSAQAKLLREKIMEMAGDKLVSVAAKWGAVLAAGILDAGGRNMCVALLSRTGFVRRAAVVGMAVWLHHWFWYPLSHFLGLALTPTAVIGVNKDMMIPDKFTMRCNAKPSTFAYQEALPEEKGEEKKRVETAVLSTTAKAKAKARAKAGGASEKQKDGAASMDTAADDDAKPKDDKEDKASKTDAAEEKKKNAEEVPEPDFFDLQNPCRVTYAQQQHIEFPKDQRYRPVYSIRKRNLGVLVLTDSTPDEPDETLREIKAPPLAGEEGEEPEAPEPFEWVPPEHRQA